MSAASLFPSCAKFACINKKTAVIRCLFVYVSCLYQSDELDNCHFSSVTAARTNFINTGKAALAVCVFRSDLVKQFSRCFFVHELSPNSPCGS